jgi:EAL domain-containing protein (putative c-di-GMP-specific phosphodiesterase class I)
MENRKPEVKVGHAPFGKRRTRPRVCVADNKQHIRTFLSEALEEFGFITCECAHVDALDRVLAEHGPDLVVLGLSSDGMNGADVLQMLATAEFKGKVLPLGSLESPMVKAVRKLGEELGLDMLPLLATPFNDELLRNSIAGLLPIGQPPNPPVDVAEAVNTDWLELWYQPKISTRMFRVVGAEGLIRMRHPTWGIVEPAYFIPADGDPHFLALSEFVVRQAIEDWCWFVGRHGRLEIAINLPLSVLQATDPVNALCARIPNHPAFTALIVEIHGTEVVRNLERVAQVAKELRFHNIGISIDDLGVEWPMLMELEDFPFVEIKVDRRFVTGCAQDSLKRTICRRILDFAEGAGARTVAEGVETRTDFLCVREMGFDLAQGYLFGKAMPPHKFAKKLLDRSIVVAMEA